MPLHDPARAARGRPRPHALLHGERAPTRARRGRHAPGPCARHSASTAATAPGSAARRPEHARSRCPTPACAAQARAQALRWRAALAPCSITSATLVGSTPTSSPRPASPKARARAAAQPPGLVARGAVEHGGLAAPAARQALELLRLPVDLLGRGRRSRPGARRRPASPSARAAPRASTQLERGGDEIGRPCTARAAAAGVLQPIEPQRRPGGRRPGAAAASAWPPR